MAKNETLVGDIDAEVLAFTAGQDRLLDGALVDADCIGSAAHATMLSRLEISPRIFTNADLKKVVAELTRIMARAQAGTFSITAKDQDVHLAVERALTEALGDLGKRIHTARSRNDQVALDLRLFAKEQLLGCFLESLDLSSPSGPEEDLAAALAAVHRFHRAKRRALGTDTGERAGWLARSRAMTSDYARRAGRSGGQA